MESHTSLLQYFLTVLPYFLVLSNFIFHWMSTESSISFSMLAPYKYLLRRYFPRIVNCPPPHVAISFWPHLALRRVAEGAALHLPWLATPYPQTHPVCLSLTCAYDSEGGGTRTPVASRLLHALGQSCHAHRVAVRQLQYSGRTLVQEQRWGGL